MCVGAETGNQQDIERKATYISNLNRFLAERHLSAAELTNPELKVEKVYLTFQDGVEAGKSKFRFPRSAVVATKEFQNFIRPSLDMSTIITHGHNCVIAVSGPHLKKRFIMGGGPSIPRSPSFV